jgi:hypothetical protein
MSTWRPPWSAQGQFKLTLLPATRASNSVTARRPPGPGSTAALRAGVAGTPAPRDVPADLGWPGGCQTGHRPRPGLVGLSPSGHAQPAQPQPAPHELRTRAGGNRPDATTATPTGGYGEAEQSLQLLFAVGDRARAPVSRRLTDLARTEGPVPPCGGHLRRSGLRDQGIGSAGRARQGRGRPRPRTHPYQAHSRDAFKPVGARGASSAAGWQ